MKFTNIKKRVDAAMLPVYGSAEHKKVQSLELILNIVNTINSTLILDDLLKLVLINAIKISESDRGFIVLKSLEGKLDYKLGMDIEGNLIPKELFNISVSVIDDVYFTGQSRFIEGASTDTDFDSSKSITRLELQTILCSPLISNGKKIGVIYVDSKHFHSIKIREITDTFEILAGQAATAIRNAQMYQSEIKANHALQEANNLILKTERKLLKSGIDAEIGQSLQGLVHMAILESESLLRTIEKTEKENNNIISQTGLNYDRLKIKTKVAIDSIRKIQKYAQALIETSIISLNIDSGDLNKTIQSVIKYITPLKKYSKVIFKTELSPLPLCKYDSEQIQHVLISLFNNAVEARSNATIKIRTKILENSIFVEIEDDGPGIPENIRNTFFEHPLDYKEGYGLFMCKSIIERHKGKLDIKPGSRGTIIQFTLQVDTNNEK